MSLWLSFFAIVALLAMSFFFSGSETALTAASRARMYQLAKSGNKRASVVEKLTAEKERLIGAILLATTSSTFSPPPPCRFGADPGFR